tara:strand:- start:327 stop:806 length:480 start_codon:yes stop_codon:yes gene_type:complete
LNDILIRGATAADADVAGRAAHAAWLKGIAPLVPAGTSGRVSASDFVSFVRELPEQVLIAERGGEIAGIGACEHGDNHISDIWVAPPHEGKGLGAALVRALEKRIAARRYQHVTISVLSDNERAFALYRHLGYRITAEGLSYDRYLLVDLMTSHLEKRL